MASEFLPATFEYSNRKEQPFGGAVADEKGRKIGVIITTETRNVTAREDGKSGWLAKPEHFGVMYGVRVQKSKDGKSWGASQPMKWFKSEDEAKAHWVNKVADRIADNWK